MATDVERSRLPKVSDREKFYSPDILPLLQAVLADLADIDFAYETSLDAIRDSEAHEGRKSELIATLRDRHRKQRAPYIQELAALRERIETTFL
jgi:hypothetical protein